MPQVAIRKCNASETIPKSFLEKMEAITDSIRERAFETFQSRGGGHGSDLKDWLQAERDEVWSPAAELVEDEKEFKARITLPGFDAKEIEVTALPDALVVQAAAAHNHEGESGNVCFCEFSEKELFRRLDLPASVDVDKVTASLDKGMLQINAPKAAPKKMTAGA
jgi:HSP20 family molecular chaperone IbpA